MACMEHSCACGWFFMDNTPGPDKCPVCGGNVSHVFDEWLQQDKLDSED